MIAISQIPVKNSATAKRGSRWEARCTVDGVEYQASSRNGASTALARKLVAAGVPDQPVQVYDQGRKALYWPSLYAMAQWTYSEGDKPLSRKLWRPHPAATPFPRHTSGSGRDEGGGHVDDGPECIEPIE